MKYIFYNECLTDSQNIGEQLKCIRGSTGYTQEAAARLTGHTRDWLANIETGRTSARFTDVIDLLVAYDRLGDLKRVVFSIESTAGARKSFIKSVFLYLKQTQIRSSETPVMSPLHILITKPGTQFPTFYFTSFAYIFIFLRNKEKWNSNSTFCFLFTFGNPDGSIFLLKLYS